jgi:hypothetical protein
LGAAPAQVDPDLLHRLEDDGMDSLRRLSPGGFGAHVLPGVPLEQGLGHLRTTRILRADEQNVLHGPSS